MPPKRHDVICESLRLVLEMSSDAPAEARDYLVEMLAQFQRPVRWSFVMLNPEQQRFVLRAIAEGPRPFQTLKVWAASISHIRYDTGEVMASRMRLSEDTDIPPSEVSRSLARLAEIGALVPVRRGRYAINPEVGWSGSLVQRERATKGATSLRPVT